jgi:hypothetical protein
VVASRVHVATYTPLGGDLRAVYPCPAWTLQDAYNILPLVHKVELSILRHGLLLNMSSWLPQVHHLFGSVPRKRCTQLDLLAPWSAHILWLCTWVFSIVCPAVTGGGVLHASLSPPGVHACAV